MENIEQNNAMTDYMRAFFKEWSMWEFDGKMLPVPSNAKLTITRFEQFGLALDQVFDAINISMSRAYVLPEDKFVYMCGIIWNRLADSVPGYTAKRQSN